MRRFEARDCPVRNASKFPDHDRHAERAPAIRSAGNPARGHLLGLSIRCVRHFRSGVGTLGSSTLWPAERIWLGWKPGFESERNRGCEEKV